MSILTKSAFYYGHTVTTENNAIDFNEGGSELNATLNIGNYSLTEYAAEIKRALDAAGALTYTVTFNRTTRIITISAGSNFALLTTSGTRAGTSAFSMAGFSGADKTGANSYAGSAGSGSEFLPMSRLDDYIPSSLWKGKQDGVVNRAASGRIQAVYFGDVKFFQMNIVNQANDGTTRSGIITANASGLDQLVAFMDYAITKGKMEFMPDVSSRSTFYKIVLESTRQDKNGLEYQLKKIAKAHGYYETDAMVMRDLT